MEEVVFRHAALLVVDIMIRREALLALDLVVRRAALLAVVVLGGAVPLAVAVESGAVPRCWRWSWWAALRRRAGSGRGRWRRAAVLAVVDVGGNPLQPSARHEA